MISYLDGNVSFLANPNDSSMNFIGGDNFNKLKYEEELHKRIFTKYFKKTDVYLYEVNGVLSGLVSLGKDNVIEEQLPVDFSNKNMLDRTMLYLLYSVFFPNKNQIRRMKQKENATPEIIKDINLLESSI